MNEPLLMRLSGEYLTALRTYLKQGSKAGLEKAFAFGETAVNHGIETLELARIHDQALAKVMLPDLAASNKAKMSSRASLFFAEANMSIEETHQIALEAKALLSQARATLAKRTAELSKSKGLLKRGIMERRTAVKILKLSELESVRLLEESHVLERHLRAMSHKILSADEDARKKVSLQLNDEIVQTLLGIQIRILFLKGEVAVHQADLSKEIAATQQLVDESIGFMAPFFHKFDTQHED